MSDLINRQDAINCCSCLHPEECWDEIRKLPSADAIATFRTGQTYGKSTSIRELVEVVRCKDCKHWYSDADTGMACEFTNMSQPEDGYCNWGERREL